MAERGGSVPQEIVQAVWEAEDGRCEACKRPMDKRWARVARIGGQGAQTVDNLQLLCVDCKAHRPDPLRARLLVVSEAAAARVLGSVEPDRREAATRRLQKLLQQYGVIVGGGQRVRSYWLPGVGTFRIELGDNGTATIIALERMQAQPELKVKPQARTRGLPAPDRSPLPLATGTRE